MKKQKQTKERYFVGAVGEQWDQPSNSYSNLSMAIRDAFEYRATGDFCGRPIFIAKEISYGMKVNTKTGEVKIVPIGDIKSTQPYYLIKDYRGTITTYGGDCDTDCHDVKSGEDLEKLLIKNKLPQLGENLHLAHGIEFKVKRGKK